MVVVVTRKQPSYKRSPMSQLIMRFGEIDDFGKAFEPVNNSLSPQYANRHDDPLHWP